MKDAVEVESPARVWICLEEAFLLPKKGHRAGGPLAPPGGHSPPTVPLAPPMGHS